MTKCSSQQYFLLAAGALLLSVIEAGASPSSCAALHTLAQQVSCMEENHPDYLHSGLLEEEAKLVVQQARQFRNPEFSLRSVGGDNFGMGIGSSELAITYPFPLSPRRSSAVRAAKAGGEQLRAQAQLARYEAKSNFIKDLFRARQIEEEQKWYKFVHDQLLAQKNTYLRRAVREPEQDISLGLVRLMIADNLTKQSLLDIEKREVRNRLQRALGSETSLNTIGWPVLKKKWPDLHKTAELKAESRPEISDARAKQEQALAEWSFARASTWPEFNFGPVLQRANEGPNVYYAYGLQVTFELPVLSWNMGTRALKAKQHAHSIIEMELMQQKQNYLLETYLQQYQKSIEAESQLPTPQEITRKAQMTQSYFQRGMLTGPTILESYRQTVESVLNRHRLETLTLEAFLWLKLTQGRDPVPELEALL